MRDKNAVDYLDLVAGLARRELIEGLSLDGPDEDLPPDASVSFVGGGLPPGEAAQNLPGTKLAPALWDSAVDLAVPRPDLSAVASKVNGRVRVSLSSSSASATPIDQFVVANSDNHVLFEASNRSTPPAIEKDLGAAAHLSGQTLRVWIVVDYRVATTEFRVG